MKKLLYTFLAAMCCTVMALAANSKATKIEYEPGKIMYFILNENHTATVTWGGNDSFSGTTEYAGSITIPSTVKYANKDYTVTGIGDNAFLLCNTMSSVTIPEGVTSIGKMAFMACTGLNSITIPEGVTSIGASAFENTGWYNGQKDGLVYLSNYLLGLKGENKPTNIVIKDGTMTIADQALSYCLSLVSIAIPASVNSIGAEAFRECESLTSITIPKNVTSIGTDAFATCKGLASITVVEGNTIYESPDNCNALIEKSTQTLLWGCKNTVIPNTVKNINSSAFYKHTGLTSITIPESVTSIGNSAFQSTGLTSVIIGKSVETIGKNAFRNCTYMTEIDVLATAPPELGTDAFDIVPKDIPVYVPDVDAYKKKSWGGFTNLIKYVDLPTAKEEAIAGLKTFINEEKIANAPKEKYESSINAATAKKDIPSIVNNIKAEINNYTKFTLGEWKYLLDKNDEKYTIVGDKLTFTDKDLYQSDYDFTVDGSITYSRTFTNKNWQALYVPFAISSSDWGDDFDVAAINNFHEYTDADGKTVKTELEIRMVKSGTLKPNHPYLIKAHDAAAEPQEINLSTKEISKSDNKSYSCSSMESQYTFTGTYQEMNKLKTNDYIFMSGGKLCKAEDDEVVLSSQRWYLKITSLGSQVDGGNTSDVKAMEFDIKLLDDEPTGIDEITVTRTPLTDDSEAIYNLNGMRVNDNYKGIVIKNGKKYVVK